MIKNIFGEISQTFTFSHLADTFIQSDLEVSQSSQSNFIYIVPFRQANSIQSTFQNNKKTNQMEKQNKRNKMKTQQK